MADTKPLSARLPKERRPRLRPEVAFVAVAGVLASFFIAAGAPTPLLPIYEREWSFAPWVLTLVFGVYAVALLLALLVTGSLSDHIGRRPVLIGSVALELVGMLVFLAAQDVEILILARVIQGVATGAGTGALTAAVVELAPEKRKRIGAIIGSISAAAGLALGTLVAGIIAEFSNSATVVTWSIFVAIMIVALVVVILTPETTGRTAGARQSLIPRIAVPPEARRHFRAAIPSLLGAWMMAALFMGLAPTILATVFSVHSPFADGAVAFLEPAAAAVTGLLIGRIAPQRTMLIAGSAVVIGAIVVIVAIATSRLPLLCIGGVVGGIGFGGTLSGSFRDLTPRAKPHERAGLFAAIYLVAPVGLTGVAIAFGAVIVVASAVGLVDQTRVSRSDSVPATT